MVLCPMNIDLQEAIGLGFGSREGLGLGRIAVVVCVERTLFS